MIVNNEDNNSTNIESNIINDIDSESKGVVANSNCNNENGDFEVHIACLFSWLYIFQSLKLKFSLFFWYMKKVFSKPLL